MNQIKPVTPIRLKESTDLRTADLEQRISRRAYELFEQRGKKHGQDLDDWLKAEAEVTRKWRTAV